MSTQIQRRRGTTAQHASFTGAVGETTIDTDKEVVVVHDGVQVGGYPLMRENGSNSALALGSAGTPSLKFTGDTNTGIYSPGADQVAISTGGSGRLFVDASGNVGINIASPSSFESGARNLVVGSGSGDNGLSIYSGTANQGIIYFADGTTTAQKYTGFIAYDHSTNAMRFGTNDGNERLRITSTGALNFVGAGTAGSTQAVSFNGSAPVNSLVIDSSGRLGIGTSSPSYQLDLGGGTTTSRRIQLQRGSDDGGQHMRLGWDGIDMVRSNVSLANPQTSFSLNQVGSDGTRTCLHVDTSGRLGIGTTSASAKLDVATGALSGAILVGGDVNTDTGARTDATRKYFVMGAYPYTNAHQKSTLLVADNDGTDNIVYLGGGQALLNAATSLRFHTAANNNTASGTERARIDSSGRLLVGTSSGSNNLRLNQNFTVVAVGNSSYGGMSLTGYSGATDASASPILDFQRSRGNTDGSYTEVVTGDQLGAIAFRGADGVGWSEAAAIKGEADGDWTTSGDTTDSPGRLVFSTTADGASSPTERMRISQNGKTQMFANANDNVLVMRSAEGAGTATYIFAGARSATGIGDGTVVFGVFTNGNAVNTNNSYGALSDIKLKENIVDANSQWSDIKALQVRKYNFKEETGQQTHTQIGLVAQEVELVSPGLVTESPDRDAEGNDLGTVTKSVNYSVLYMKAVKALQEAMERIETLEAKVAALEAN